MKHKPVTRTRMRKPPSFNSLTPKRVRDLRRRLAEQRLAATQLQPDEPLRTDDTPKDS